MPKIRIEDLYKFLEPEEDINEDPKALSDQVIVSSDDFSEYEECLAASRYQVHAAESDRVKEEIIECTRNFKAVIHGVAIDNSVLARPEDFFSGEILPNGDIALTVSFFDLSSFIEFESPLFYRALDVNQNTYDRDRGILLESMLPREMIGTTFQELKKMKKFPCISVKMIFTPDLLEVEKVVVFDSVVKIDYQTDFETARRILRKTENVPFSNLRRNERHLRILHDVACKKTRFSPANDGRAFGQITELKQLALGYLGSAIAADRIPAVWKSTFHHRMLRHMPIFCSDNLWVCRGFQDVTDELVNDCRAYLDWCRQKKISRLAFATDKPGTYDPTDYRTSFRFDNPLRESLGLLNGYSVRAFLERGDTSTESHTDISALSRVIACRAATINSRLMEFVTN